jgi:hypothetical protein
MYGSARSTGDRIAGSAQPVGPRWVVIFARCRWAFGAQRNVGRRPPIPGVDHGSTSAFSGLGDQGRPNQYLMPSVDLQGLGAAAPLRQRALGLTA